MLRLLFRNVGRSSFPQPSRLIGQRWASGAELATGSVPTKEEGGASTPAKNTTEKKSDLEGQLSSEDEKKALRAKKSDAEKDKETRSSSSQKKPQAQAKESGSSSPDSKQSKDSKKSKSDGPAVEKVAQSSTTREGKGKAESKKPRSEEDQKRLEWRSELSTKRYKELLEVHAYAKENNIEIPDAPQRRPKLQPNASPEEFAKYEEQIKSFVKRARLLDRLRAQLRGVVKGKEFSVEDAIDMVVKHQRRPTQGIRVNFVLGIDASKSNQLIRHVGVLPHGPLAAKRKIVVFAKPELHEEAKAAGADVVGYTDLIKEIEESGTIECDRVIATPDMIRPLAKIARILGERNLMPNPKFGSLTENIEDEIKAWRHNKLFLKNTKIGNVEFAFGVAGLGKEKLVENFAAACFAIYEAKPTVIKKGYVKTIRITASYEKPMLIDKASINELLSQFEKEEKLFMTTGVVTTKGFDAHT
ncbi:hypothetical protein NDN08_000169 [Rhodosorus marinus]|uniref:Large ribosomal subunit protein uL1c n=1 Tax=Rhodosorus marinus TaxID=101924 RepID=A0AAV8UEF7_9RHOD|nr:hypothetical protein NDN08_000169 [Rhodosorus marinus]